MNLRYIVPLIAVIILFLIAYLGAQVSGLQYVFGVVVPYLAILTFVVGFAYRVISWTRSPVPSRERLGRGTPTSVAGRPAATEVLRTVTPLARMPGMKLVSPMPRQRDHCRRPGRRQPLLR